MFAAVTPSEAAVADLDDFLTVRREAAPFRWALAEQLHVTLAFVADVPERSLDQLVEGVGRAAGRQHRFEARLAGGGAFPHAARARVLWCGVETDEDGRVELGRMATGARAAAAKSGLEVAGQRFRPHVTVARLGRPAEVTSWVRLLDAYRGPVWTVDRIDLVASYLGEGPRKRPRYETVDTFPLTARRQ
jgi:RNA 2',3'-cyclic 3'-phosphodiesterase